MTGMWGKAKGGLSSIDVYSSQPTDVYSLKIKITNRVGSYDFKHRFPQTYSKHYAKGAYHQIKSHRRPKLHLIVWLPDTNFHKKPVYYEDFMKLSGIEGNIYGFNLREVPTHPDTIFKIAAIFQNGHLFRGANTTNDSNNRFQ